MRIKFRMQTLRTTEKRLSSEFRFAGKKLESFVCCEIGVILVSVFTHILTLDNFLARNAGTVSVQSACAHASDRKNTTRTAILIQKTLLKCIAIPFFVSGVLC